jgi:hypothetical protein
MAEIANPGSLNDVVFIAIASLTTAGLFRLGEFVAKKVKGPRASLVQRGGEGIGSRGSPAKVED